jgi:hypothetical protein
MTAREITYARAVKRVAAYVLSAIMLLQCSCRKEGPDKQFLETDELCLVVNGKTILTYDEKDFQISSNSEKKVFRIMDDNMGRYYQVTCSEIPYSEGQNIKADLKWANGSSVSTREALQFKVEKVTSEGKVWMWCKSKDIGVSVQVVL